MRFCCAQDEKSWCRGAFSVGRSEARLDFQMNISRNPPPSVTFDSLTFSDGTTIALDPTDIVVFVGPNNAGKSAALRELETHIGPSTSLTVIKSVQLRRSGTVEQLEAFLEKNSRKRYQRIVSTIRDTGTICQPFISCPGGRSILSNFAPFSVGGFQQKRALRIAIRQTQ